MRRIHPRMTALLLCVLLLASCGRASGEDAPPVTPVRLMKVLRFVVSSTLEPEVLAAADAFADDVERLSGGALTVEVVTGLPDQNTFARGEADLMFLRNIQMAQVDSVFSLFSLPFLYDGPAHMSIALNSREMRDELDGRLESCRITPLLALYNGSSCLVTNGREVSVPGDFKGLNIAMRPDSADRLTAFLLLGARVLPYSDAMIPEVFGTGVELKTEGSNETETVTVEAAEVGLRQAEVLAAKPDMRYLVNTWHELSPLWLTADSELLESLSERERAVLAEACAGLLAELEDGRLARERALRGEIEREGIETLEIERAQISAAIYNREIEGDAVSAVPDYFDRRIYNLIQSYSAYS